PGASRWDVSVLEAAPIETADSSPNAAARPWGVMLLDGDANVRKTMRPPIESLGCVVYEADEPITAMDLINAKPIDLILLDLALPGLHGYDVCKALRAHPPRAHLKIVITSGAGGPNELTTALENGADDYIAKPIPLTELVARVQHNLRLKGAQDRL